MQSVQAWLLIIAVLRALFEESFLHLGLGIVFPIYAWIYALIHFKEMKSEFWCITVGTIVIWTGIAVLKLGQA